MTPHRMANTALHTPSSPQISERTEDQDASFFKAKRRISFDEQVRVREYESNSWISLSDEPLSPVGVNRERKLVPVPKIIVCSSNSESIQSDPQYPILPGLDQVRPSARCLSLTQLLRGEIRNILMVDPHDIFLSLFSKRLQEALPHVRILKAHSADEALQALSKQTFDMFITEERLSLFFKCARSTKLGSGSALLSHLRNSRALQTQRMLLIGVSAHWQSDHATMAQSGADYCWSKAPPPTLHKALLEGLIHTLLLKRKKHELAKDFMMISSGATEAASDNQKQ